MGIKGGFNMFCEQCGSKIINPNDLFCPYCGARRNIVAPMENQTEVNNIPTWPEQMQPAKEEILEKNTNDVDMNKVNDQTATPEVESYIEKELSKTLVQEPKVVMEDKPIIPDGFVIDKASGWYYKSKGKQLQNGSYVNEITWYDPATKNTKVVDYPLSEQQVQAMLQANSNQGVPTQSGNATQPNQYQSPYPNQAQSPYPNQVQNPYPNQAQNPYPNHTQNPYTNQTQNQNMTQSPYPNSTQSPIPNQRNINQPYQQNQGAYLNQPQGQNQGYQGQPSAYQNQQTVFAEPKKKKKTGLIIGIVAAVVLLGLGFCTWKFEWYKVITGDNVATSNVEDEEEEEEEDIVDPTPSATPTPEPTATPTPEPKDPVVNLEEGYIVIGGQKIHIDSTTLYLDDMELTNEDIEPLQYMTYLKELYISGNNITSLRAIEGLTNLTSLDASKNDIYDIVALSKLTNLTSLYLDETQISDLSPLTGMNKLQALGITKTKVFDLNPLVSMSSLMYLYVKDSQVEDFTPLSQMPNLYMCDMNDIDSPGPNGGGTTGGQVTGNFEFTEADRLYFQPKTNNYLIMNMSTGSNDILVLFSYNQSGKCVQMRYRMNVGYDISGIDPELLTQYLGESNEVENFNYDGSIMYFDYTSVEEEFSYTKEQIIEEAQYGGYEIIANVSE